MTFARQLVLEGAKLALMQADICAPPIMWKRFKSIRYSDYYYLRVKPSFD